MRSILIDEHSCRKWIRTFQEEEIEFKKEKEYKSLRTYEVFCMVILQYIEVGPKPRRLNWELNSRSFNC